MENKVYTAIGLMSGTSLDGIDVALIETDGLNYTKLIDFKSYPYVETTRETIRSAFGVRQPNAKTDSAEKLLTDTHIKAVQDFGHKADVIGFHGQTIMHDPDQKFTWQIGDSADLAKQTGMDVIGDLRMADVAAGGQGAPLLPICHRAFAANTPKPIAILNLGGVGNVTWLGKDENDILAFDTGPANALIDDLVKTKTGKNYDQDGALAAAGQVNNQLVEEWMKNAYFNKLAPKSLDRDEWDVQNVYNLSAEDAAATLTEFTVRSVVKSIDLLPSKLEVLYVTGGGRLNKFMMRRLSESLHCSVKPAEDIGWNGDAIEAQGFAYLAVRSLLGLDITLPTTTGTSKPISGGKLYKAL